MECSSGTPASRKERGANLQFLSKRVGHETYNTCINRLHGRRFGVVRFSVSFPPLEFSTSAIASARASMRYLKSVGSPRAPSFYPQPKMGPNKAIIRAIRAHLGFILGGGSVSYGRYYWLARRTWIPCKDLCRANIVLIWNPMSILNMALLSIILTVAHMGAGSFGPYEVDKKEIEVAK